MGPVIYAAQIGNPLWLQLLMGTVLVAILCVMAVIARTTLLDLRRLLREERRAKHIYRR